MELGDTAYPPAAGPGGSFGAASFGSALFDACTHLRAKLACAAGMDPAPVSFENGTISSGGMSKPLKDLVGNTGNEADGSIEPGATLREYSQQSYGAQFAEVGVDIDTGEIACDGCWAYSQQVAC
jgi:xanthine dehydrogenase YagR molybdenum-binding subunit